MTQNERIKRHLETFGTITSKEAFNEYGCTHLAARIYDLKHKHGLSISSTRKTAINRFNEPTHYDVYKLERGSE